MVKNISNLRKIRHLTGMMIAALLSFTVLFVVSCGDGNRDSDSNDNGSQGVTLGTVQDRGVLNCGINFGLAGFASPNDSGEWEGLDVDVCRAVAAATLGDASAVNYVSLNAKERFTALQSGEIDMLSRNTTWTATRDTSLGLNFAGVNYYDGIGFLAKTATRAKEVSDLSGATICIQAGTTTEINVSDYFRANNLQYSPITYDTSQQTLDGFESGRCDVLTSDRSQLVALRSTLPNPDVAEVLDAVISKEPLGPVVRQGDDQWFNIVKWSLFAMIAGEEYNVTSDNVDALRDDPNTLPEVKRMLSVEGDLGANLGLDSDWVYNIISQVGNYEESYERNVGSGSPLQLARGVNSLWSDGGLLYAMPFR